MAENMARAHEVVSATMFDEVDVEAWWKPGADVMIRLVRSVVIGCRAVPALNAWFDGRSMVLVPKPQIDLGIAVDTEAGLIVPVLRDAGGCDGSALRHHISALVAAARARTVALGQLRDATITLSNFGMLAGTHATLVVVPPQVAIIGAGRIAPKAVPSHQGAIFRHTLPLSLTFDHRAATGGDAARFLQAMIADLHSRY
jgi:pyruvate dehydrogenase E2 component (dihydrolipoamide acetyltransferase)